MKVRITFLAFLCLALASTPAWADYYNGPINGTTDAWTINFGYVVSDTFTTSGITTGFQFGVWEYPGDTLSSVDWSITTDENGGSTIGSGTASGKNLTDQFLSSNQYGYNIDLISVSGLNAGTSSGNTYWLNLQNAAVPSGDPVYWDENSGLGCQGTGCPSLASESAVGSIPSEAFTVTSCMGCGCLNAPACSSTPEPSSLTLFGSGILALVGFLRCKLNF